MIKKIPLVVLSTFALFGCSKKEPEPTMKVEESVLQKRIDSGYFDATYFSKFKEDETLDKRFIIIYVKHEYSVSDKLFLIDDFPELNISWFSYSYSNELEEQNDYRININITLSVVDVNSVKKLINNDYVYDVQYKGLVMGDYE